MSTPTSTPLVAVVEDDTSMRTALGRLLRAAGFEASLYASAEEFLETVADIALVCLIVDVQLGGMSGLDLQARMLGRESKVPVIVITAHDEPSTRERAARLGCLAYLCKPFEGQRLVQLIPRRPGSPASPVAA